MNSPYYILPAAELGESASNQSATASYQFKILEADNRSWSEIIDVFADANIYQTWAYEAARAGRNRTVRAVLLQADRIVAAAQVRLVSPIPRLVNIAYIFWGPLWQRDDQNLDFAVLGEMLKALRNEFTVRRGLCLRILPHILENRLGEKYREILTENGFTRSTVVPEKRTLVMDVTQPLDQLRSGLEKQWRKHLRKAEVSGLTLVEGTADELFQRFLPLYRDLHSRKKFPLPNDIEQFIRMQPNLPEQHRLRIIVAQRDGTDCACAIGAALGNTGITLFRAANACGMKLNAPYMVHWRLLEWIKSRGCHWYDLMGINPKTNEGTYRYKRGLCGRNGSDQRYIGAYDCFRSPFHLRIARVAERILFMTKGIFDRLKQLPPEGN